VFAQPLLQWKSSKYYTFCTCACRLSHPAYKQHAPYYTVICALSGSTTFFHKNGIIFWKRLLNIKCVFWFSLQLLSQIFLILRTEQDIFINVHRLSCKVPVILVRFIHFLDRFLKKYSNIKSHVNPSRGLRDVSCAEMNTDMTKQIAAFHNFANVAKNWTWWNTSMLI